MECSYIEITNKTCRICFQKELDINNKLIRPCLCNGNSKYVHKNCLHKWRYSNNPVSDAYHKCMECNYTYKTLIINKKTPLSLIFIKIYNNNYVINTILLYILITCISNIICENDIFFDKLKYLAKYSLDGSYSICLIIPIYIVILLVQLYITYIIKNYNYNNYENSSKKLEKIYLCYNTIFIIHRHLVWIIALRWNI